MDANLPTIAALADLEAAAAACRSLTRQEAQRLLERADLPSVGRLGEVARIARHGNRVTFCRVCEVPAGRAAADPGAAGEVRVTGAPASAEEARTRVQEAVQVAGGAVLTGFSLADLWTLAGGDSAALAALAGALKEDGLDAVAEVPLDGFPAGEPAVAALRAAAQGGLGAWRATVTRGVLSDRLGLIERAAAIQRETGAFKAFAPLPRVDPGDQPSTGYDDVRTIALARLVCGDIPSIQVDWPLYGPKLAQVAIAYGADDIDGVAATAPPDVGRRRSPQEEIERHIRMAFAEPVERDGRHRPRS